jgi:hypothetical protein
MKKRTQRARKTRTRAKRKKPNRRAPVRTRDAFSVTVNTRTTKEIQKRAQDAARKLGTVPADIYRAAFEWWLECFDAAGGRELSDLEQRAALESIKGVSTRLYETAATYNAPAANPAKLDQGAA